MVLSPHIHWYSAHALSGALTTLLIDSLIKPLTSALTTMLIGIPTTLSTLWPSLPQQRSDPRLRRRMQYVGS